MALFEILNLSGEVKGRPLGMDLKYPKLRKRPRESTYNTNVGI